MLPAHVERRAQPRIVLEAPALLRFDDDARLAVVAADLSSSGLGITCAGAVASELARRVESPDPIAAKCLVSVQMPDGYARANLDTVARLAWIRQREDGSAEAGLTFASLAPEDCAFVDQIVREAIADARAAVMQLIS